MIRDGVTARLRKIAAARSVQVGLAAALMIAALVALHGMSADLTWSDVKVQISGIPIRLIALSIVATAISFLAVGAYDVIGLHAIAKNRVPVPVALATGAAGAAVSNVVGFGIVTGGAMRMRIYTGLGLPLPIAAQIVAMTNIWTVAGLLALLAAALLVHPAGLVGFLPLSPALQMLTGLALFGGIVLLVRRLVLRHPTFSVLGYDVPLPSGRHIIAGIATGAIDVGFAAIALYAVLPADLDVPFPTFLMVYIGALLLGLLSMAPGGIGVFEASVIGGLGASGRADVLAALALYRLVYYVLPLCITVFIAAVLASKRPGGRKTLGFANSIMRPVIPPLAAGLALLSGSVLLVSGSLPAVGTRLSILRDFVPLGVIEGSHLLGSVAGVMLLVVARGLLLRRARAWSATIGLLLIGLGASAMKGLDWEEALITGASVVVLWTFRGAFYRREASLFRLPWRWLCMGAVLTGLAIWVGLEVNRVVPYDTDLWWNFAWTEDAPRFLRASLVAAVTLLAVATNSLLVGHGPRLPPQPIPSAVRRLALGADNTEGQIALTGGKRYLTAPDETAFLSYADSGRTLICKGDPIGDHEAGVALLWQLRELADRMGRRSAFYAVWSEYLPTYLDMGLSILKIGEVARVDLLAFNMNGSHRKGLRSSRSRAAREGVCFEIVSASDLAPLLPELRQVSDEWLELKQGREKEFALGSFDEPYLKNFDHALLRQGSGGPILAFANLMKGTAGGELSIDLMRHGRKAPTYAMDVLFVEMFLWGQSRGFRWFSLGAAPFGGFEAHRLASTWIRLGRFVFDHGERFYHFEGLREFKEKFDPVWSPNYLAAPRGISAARVLLQVNGLVSGGIRGIIKSN